MPNPMNPDEIYKEVERRKARAKELKISDVVFDTYEKKYLKYYPTWFSSEHNREALPPEVIGAESLDNKGVKIRLASGTYTFKYAEKVKNLENDVWIDGEFELLAEDQLVLAFSVYGVIGEYVTEYSINDIEAFIEGPWVEDLRRLSALIEAYNLKRKQEREKRERDDPQKLADLRKRFGI